MNNPLGASVGMGIHEFKSTLIYTSELILCSTICVPSATRHNNLFNLFCTCFGYVWTGS